MTKSAGPKEPIRSEVAARTLGVTRARVYQLVQDGRLRGWQARGAKAGDHSPIFLEAAEVEALGEKMQELRRLAAEVGDRRFDSAGKRARKALPTEFQEMKFD